MRNEEKSSIIKDINGEADVKPDRAIIQTKLEKEEEQCFISKTELS